MSTWLHYDIVHYTDVYTNTVTPSVSVSTSTLLGTGTYICEYIIECSGLALVTIFEVFDRLSFPRCIIIH